MPIYVGIDLHSSNSYLGIIDHKNRRLFDKRLRNKLDIIAEALKPFKRRCKGIVVESTYNWYWLVDGLSELGYKMHLANPTAIKQYQGLKHTDDKSDAFWLAEMLKLGILREGYIYPAEDRPVRDLLRRRLMYVRQKTAHMLSLKGMAVRHLGKDIPTNTLKRLSESDAAALFEGVHLKIAAKTAMSTIHFLTTQIRAIEREVLREIKPKREFELLQTIPGIGNILGLKWVTPMFTLCFMWLPTFP
jgi:transposase